jgi:hypothetical protein
MSKAQESAEKTTIDEPNPRRGTTTSINQVPYEVGQFSDDNAVQSHTQMLRYVESTLANLSGDENYMYIANRLQGFVDFTDYCLGLLECSIEENDFDSIHDTARDLTEFCGRIDAMNMMRTSIALQMMGRRKLLDRAQELLRDLVSEYGRLRQDLFAAKGISETA